MSRKSKTPDFYERYPALFHNYYPAISIDTINTLSEAGYIFYRSILQLDAIIDNKEMHLLFSVLDLQEDAIKN